MILMLNSIERIYGQDFNPCNNSPEVKKFRIAKYKDGSYSVLKKNDTSRLYLYDSLRHKLVNTNTILSINEPSKDIFICRIIKAGNYLVSIERLNGLLTRSDTLMNIMDSSISTTFGNASFENKRDIESLKLEEYKELSKWYYIVYSDYKLEPKFSRTFISKKNLFRVKIETCYKALPYCPIEILECDNCR
jgi:hypothetical protein